MMGRFQQICWMCRNFSHGFAKIVPAQHRAHQPACARCAVNDSGWRSVLNPRQGVGIAADGWDGRSGCGKHGRAKGHPQHDRV